MKDLTIVLITNRNEPKIEWFIQSLPKGEEFHVICVDSQAQSRPYFLNLFNGEEPALSQIENCFLSVVNPKPSFWSGPKRLTKDQWWSVSNQRNSGICLCRTKWICFVDDRSVLMPGWIGHIKAAMESPDPYVLAGRYEKRKEMTVENGAIKHGGTITGKDHRYEYVQKYWSSLKPPLKCGGEWTFGCTIALPLEWALEVGGFDETCDGLSGEDPIFGLMLQNNGREIRYEPRMLMVEDRTPSECGPTYKRSDFGVSPNDFSHKVLNLLKDRKTAMHGFDIRKVREDALNGKPWPAPWGPTHHLWDGKPLVELT